MSEYPALPLFCDAWTLDTKHLTRGERGTYLDLLILIWTTPKCRVPNDPSWIEQRLGYPRGDAELSKIINEFCTTDKSRHWLTQKRLKKEYSYVKTKILKMSKLAKARWGKGKDPSTPPSSSSLRKKRVARAREKDAGALATRRSPRSLAPEGARSARSSDTPKRQKPEIKWVTPKRPPRLDSLNDEELCKIAATPGLAFTDEEHAILVAALHRKRKNQGKTNGKAEA